MSALGRRAAVRHHVSELCNILGTATEAPSVLAVIESTIDPDSALARPIRRTLAIEAALDAIEHVTDPAREVPEVQRRCHAIEVLLVRLQHASDARLESTRQRRFAVAAFSKQHARRMEDVHRFHAARAKGLTPEQDDGSSPAHWDPTGDLAVWNVMRQEGQTGKEDK